MARAEAKGQRYVLSIMGLQFQGVIKKWMRVRSGAVNSTSTDSVSGCSLRIDHVSMMGVYWVLVQSGTVQRVEVIYNSRAQTEMWPSCVDGGFTAKHHGNIADGVRLIREAKPNTGLHLVVVRVADLHLPCVQAALGCPTDFFFDLRFFIKE